LLGGALVAAGSVVGGAAVPVGLAGADGAAVADEGAAVGACVSGCADGDFAAQAALTNATQETNAMTTTRFTKRNLFDTMTS